MARRHSPLWSGIAFPSFHLALLVQGRKPHLFERGHGPHRTAVDALLQAVALFAQLNHHEAAIGALAEEQRLPEFQRALATRRPVQKAIEDGVGILLVLIRSSGLDRRSRRRMVDGGQRVAQVPAGLAVVDAAPVEWADLDQAKRLVVVPALRATMRAGMANRNAALLRRLQKDVGHALLDAPVAVQIAVPELRIAQDTRPPVLT